MPLNYLPKDTPTTPSLPDDISPRMIDLARVIDRLPPGQHVITITKPDVRAMEWTVVILSVHHNRTLTLSKKVNGRSPNGSSHPAEP